MNDERIAVSGSAGIGKSMLCGKLVRAYRYPLIPDLIDTVLKEHGHSSWRDVSSPAEAVEIRLNALQRKISLEANRATFISDKSVVDYLAYWELNAASDASAEDRETFESAVMNHLERYGLILLLLWGRIAMQRLDRRHADPVHQFRVHSAITRRLLQLRAPFAVFDQLPAMSGCELCEQVADLALRPTPATSRQVGLFIGTFDPPTNGHLKCALQAKELLDEVWFCPNPDNPNCARRHLPLAQRARMLELVAGDNHRLRVYLRDHNPYVASQPNARPRSELITEVRQKNPSVQFWVLLGGDRLETEAYKAPDPELRQTGHIVFERPDEPNLAAIAKLDLWISLATVGTESSTEVKRRLSQGTPAWDLVPRAVGEYITTHDLYRRGEEGV